MKVCKCCRRFLPRVQNSVFEGEISESKLAKLKSALEKIIVPVEDSVLFWILRNDHWVQRETMGYEKLPISNFL
jgi:CRISPR-associated protein Cas2